MVPPGETWARVAPFLPAMGITRVADLTGLDVIGIPVFQAVRPNGRTMSVSQGKGITDELARVSAVMESIETWHAEEAHVLPSIEAAVGEMAPHLPYSVFDLPSPERSVLSENTRLRWVSGRSLGGGMPGEPTWIPRACVVLDCTDPLGWSPPVLCSDSNGLASGNTLEEALLHGLYEVAERDAVARTPDDRSGLEVDRATVSGASAELLERFARADAHVRVYDITAAPGLFCYDVEIWSADLPTRFAGWGCHRDADVALSRALTEAAQSRLTMIAGSRDDIPDDLFHRVSSRSHLRVPFDPPCPARSFPGETPLPDSWDADLETAVGAIGALTGEPVFWVDLTRPEFDIPVVRVIAPGLQLTERLK